MHQIHDCLFLSGIAKTFSQFLWFKLGHDNPRQLLVVVLAVEVYEDPVVLALSRPLHGALNKILEVIEDKEELCVRILDLRAEPNVQEAREARLDHKTEHQEYVEYVEGVEVRTLTEAANIRLLLVPLPT